ncbi:MAG: hypothetical protein JO208_15080 [Alphaproteobacteria bacterium]|nr:hypothetical protein [Alphaproteobacteria bacterium]
MMGLLFGGAIGMSGSVFAQPDIRVREHARPDGHPGLRARVDAFHRAPPGVRLRAAPGRVTVRTNAFRSHLGWRVSRFTPRERALWTHGHWWHGRHHGRFGWWWWVDGSWFFYETPLYPYPDYVSETYYEEPAQDSGDYWYYCRDPEGYYPYVRQCDGSWEPVPAQPSYSNGPNGDDMDSDDYGPPDAAAPGDEYGPDDYGPPDEAPDDGGPWDGGPPPR